MMFFYRHFFGLSMLQILRVGILASMTFFSPIFASDESSDRENKIKIAYLFHFGQFVEWTIKTPVFTYCIYENLDFSDLLKQAYNAKTLDSLLIEVQNVNATSTMTNCHIVYFPKEVSVHVLSQISNKPILSIGTQKNFNQIGGIIYLFEEEHKIRFSINNANALKLGLKISSQLLSLSKEPQP